MEERIAPDWLKWLKGEHIPEILATGCFTEAVVFDLLEPYDGEGVTFVVQYKTESRENYERYMKEYAETMRQKSFSAWGNRFIAFRSLLKVIH